jgi:hypothetical protein
MSTLFFRLIKYRTAKERNNMTSKSFSQHYQVSLSQHARRPQGYAGIIYSHFAIFQVICKRNRMLEIGDGLETHVFAAIAL